MCQMLRCMLTHTRNHYLLVQTGHACDKWLMGTGKEHQQGEGKRLSVAPETGALTIIKIVCIN